MHLFLLLHLDYLACVPCLLEDVAINFGENVLKWIIDFHILLVETDLAMWACTLVKTRRLTMYCFLN